MPPQILSHGPPRDCGLDIRQPNEDPASMTGPPDGGPPVGPWMDLYQDLVRLERHLTDQRQNQQNRIATILAVAGLMLGLFSSADLGLPHTNGQHSLHVLFLVGLVCLGLSLLLGVSALWPVLPFANEREPWMDANALRGLAESCRESSEFYYALCEALREHLMGRNHLTSMRRRRWLMWGQLSLIALAIVLLLVALVGIRSRA